MRLADLLDEKVIKIGLASEDKEECLEELVDLLVRSERVSDRQSAVAALHQRERLGSTGIGNGVAIPHGKSTTVKNLTAALGVSRDGIEFDSVDGEPVHVVFLVLAEANNPGPHVAALAEIARLLQVPGFCRRLSEAPTAEAVLDIFNEEE